MGTSLDTVVDRALITIADYKLNRIFTVDPETFKHIVEGYMIRGIPKFDGCLKSLAYDSTLHCFYETFDIYEIDIIASWVVIEWYERELQDVLEFREPLKDADFARYSTGQNLRPRQEYINELRRKVKQDVTNYQLLHLTQLPYFNIDNGGAL